MNCKRIFTICMLCTFILILLQGFTIYAKTEERQYIVEFTDEILLFCKCALKSIFRQAAEQYETEKRYNPDI